MVYKQIYITIYRCCALKNFFTDGVEWSKDFGGAIFSKIKVSIKS